MKVYVSYRTRCFESLFDFAMASLLPAIGWPRAFALTPDDRVLVMIDRGSQEIYALDVEYK